ncbi:MAG: hypothetical protein HZB38_07910 [Planctomycetes bacterium]|nr:hypothetical protein [Planctomycetota bacterium]
MRYPQAKSTAGKAALKALGDGLEMFRNANPSECPGDGFPRSKPAEDETEPGTQDIFGAQWLVRYLVGKDFQGYIPPKKAPAAASGAQAGYKQQNWYNDPVNNDAAHNSPPFDKLPRSEQFIDADRLKLIRPLHEPAFAGDREEGLPNPPDPIASLGLGIDARTLDQPVFVDPFGFPILYFAANSRLASDPKAAMSTPGYGDAQSGVYSLADNGIFTGTCASSAHASCRYRGWDLGETGLTNDEWHPIRHHGDFPSSPSGDVPNPQDMRNPVNQTSFAHYILNKSVYDSSSGNVLAPYRKTSFLMMTPGPDGIYGTSDDINNFAE